MTKKKVFEFGKNYKHSSGKTMKICGIATTHTYGLCLIGEDNNGRLIPVGDSPSHFTNWEEDLTQDN